MQSTFLFLVLRIIILGYLASHGACRAEETSKNAGIQTMPASDLLYQDSSDIRAPEAEFEGRYRVGKTSCSVIPVKMAFEVKWKKGQGVMLFFFDTTTPDGKTIFLSKDLGKGRDQFIFYDNGYNDGLFVRADGKKFKVERLNE